jgi:hypothetical protein
MTEECGSSKLLREMEENIEFGEDYLLEAKFAAKNPAKEWGYKLNFIYIFLL